ncbi:MAG: type II secretion system protein N [Rhizobium sp.]|nr:type II secretion system protein N [Rhizobium sp.]
MKRGARLALGLGLYLVALAAFAPAQLLDARLGEASAGHLRLAAARGTLWSGQARAELRDANGATAWAAPVAWRLRPAGLLAARLDYALSTGPGASLSAMSFSRSQVQLQGVDIRVPAATLAAAVPALSPWGLGGEVRVTATQLGFGPTQASGAASLHWSSASSRLSPVSPLGDYALDVEGLGQHWQARLQTLAGPLQLSGEGGWQPGARARFEAIATAPPAVRAELAPFLRLVAVERGDGQFSWRLP